MGIRDAGAPLCHHLSPQAARSRTSLESELDFVVGLGEKRKRALLAKFSSVDDIRARTADEIADVKGMNRVLAERVLLQLSEDQEAVEAGLEPIDAERIDAESIDPESVE